MQRLLLIILLIPIHLFAQDSLAYSEFRFTLLETNGKDLAGDVLEATVAKISVSDTSNKELDYVFTKLEYSIK
ncbi:MAG: hypothetical protein ACHQFW_11125, partial [Chitinophagales bacterium]